MLIWLDKSVYKPLKKLIEKKGIKAGNNSVRQDKATGKLQLAANRRHKKATGSNGNNAPLSNRNSKDLVTSNRALVTGHRHNGEGHRRDPKAIKGHRQISSGLTVEPVEIVEVTTISSDQIVAAANNKGHNVRSSHAGRRVMVVVSQKRKAKR